MTHDYRKRLFEASVQPEMYAVNIDGLGLATGTELDRIGDRLGKRRYGLSLDESNMRDRFAEEAMTRQIGLFEW